MSDESPTSVIPCPPGAAGHYLHKAIRNSALNYAAQLFNGLCYVVVVVTLAHGLGKEGIGEYYTIFAITMAVQITLEGGVGTVLTFRIAQAPEKWQQLMGEAASLFVVVVACSVLTVCLVGAGWAQITANPGRMVSFAAAACACAGMQVQRFCLGMFRAFEMFQQESLSRVIQGGLFAVAVVVLTVTKWSSVETAVAALAISHLAVASYLLLLVLGRWGCPVLRLDYAIGRDWLTHAAPLAIGDVLRELAWQLDTLLLGFLQPAAVVGVYCVAYRPLGPLKWLPQAILPTLFPAFSRMAVDDLGELDRSFANGLRLLWVMSIPMAVGVFVYAEPLVVLLGGREFLVAAVPMRILIWCTTLSYLTIPFRFLFTALGKQQVFARLMVLLFVVEVVVETSAIPRFSYFGACAGIFAGELAFLGCSVGMCYRLRIKGIPWGAMFRALLGGALLGALLWSTRGAAWSSLLLILVLALGAYFGWCVVFRALYKAEILHVFVALKGFVRSTA